MKLLKGYARRCFDEYGELPWFAFPGGYSLVWYTGDGRATLCGKCATEEVLDYVKNHVDDGYVYYEGELPEKADIVEEGPPVFCDNCNKAIFEGYEQCVVCGEWDDSLSMAYVESRGGMLHKDCVGTVRFTSES